MKRGILSLSPYIAEKDKTTLEKYRKREITKKMAIEEINEHNGVEIDEEYFDFLVETTDHTPIFKRGRLYE